MKQKDPFFLFFTFFLYRSRPIPVSCVQLCTGTCTNLYSLRFTRTRDFAEVKRYLVLSCAQAAQLVARHSLASPDNLKYLAQRLPFREACVRSKVTVQVSGLYRFRADTFVYLLPFITIGILILACLYLQICRLKPAESADSEANLQIQRRICRLSARLFSST